MEYITVRYRICNKFVQVIKRVSQLGNEDWYVFFPFYSKYEYLAFGEGTAEIIFGGLLNSFYCKDCQEYICKIEIDDILK